VSLNKILDSVKGLGCTIDDFVKIEAFVASEAEIGDMNDAYI
jgi:hypothetical protein